MCLARNQRFPRVNVGHVTRRLTHHSYPGSSFELQTFEPYSLFHAKCSDSNLSMDLAILAWML